MRRTTFNLVIATVAFGCMTSPPVQVSTETATMQAALAGSSAPRPPKEAPGKPSLGKVRTRNHVLTFVPTSSGLRVTVATRGGKVLAHEIAPSQLAQYSPDLADVYREGFAFLDARVDGELLRSPADPSSPFERRRAPHGGRYLESVPSVPAGPGYRAE